MGNGDLRSEGAFRGRLRGAGPALAGIVREVRAFALTRDGDWCAAIQCSLRSSPAEPVCGRCVGGFLGDGLMGNGNLGSGAVVGELPGPLPGCVDASGRSP